jgi:hypothetical protein
MAWIRRVRTASGATAVQIAESVGGRRRIVPTCTPRAHFRGLPGHRCLSDRFQQRVRGTNERQNWPRSVMRADHRSRFRRPTSRRCLGPRPNPGAPSGAVSLDTTPPSSPCRAADVRGDPPWLPLELLTAIDGAFHVFIAREIHPEEATDVDEPPRAWTKPEIATGIRALNMCKSGRGQGALATRWSRFCIEY